MSRGYWYADDAELLRLYRELGTIAAVARATGYVDPNWVRRRLRRLGVPPGKPGRPKRRHYQRHWTRLQQNGGEEQ